jgi:hypothetical protein
VAAALELDKADGRTVDNELYACARPNRRISKGGHSNINDRPLPLRDLGPDGHVLISGSSRVCGRVALRTRWLPEGATDGVE